jgi:formamidopyrimidine-DNA glycosylase
MPELAEVEYFRKQWDPGLRSRIASVTLHSQKRIFRGADPAAITRGLTGATLRHSETHGKQIVFRFSGDQWLGVHLGMTGKLRVEPGDFVPGKHDHLVLAQERRALVFADARMFGRVRFHRGKNSPPWLEHLPPTITSPSFTFSRMKAALARRQRAPLKAVLLAQKIFPGIGNWMADEILWQAKLHPRATAAELSAPKMQLLWRVTRAICRTALKTIGVDWSDPPPDWLIHERWKTSGRCPRDGAPLRRATIGGRTTAWCAKCQPRRKSL